MDVNDLENRFAYHKPATEHIGQIHSDVRAACMHLAARLNDTLPEGREKSLAITKLEEAMFWSNAAIARESNK